MDSLSDLLGRLKEQKPMKGVGTKHQLFAFELLGRLHDSYENRGIYFMLAKKYPETLLRQWLDIALERCPDNPRKYFFGILKHYNKNKP